MSAPATSPLPFTPAVPNQVVVIAPSSWPARGGVETHLGEITQELEAHGWQVKMVVPPVQRPGGKLGLLWLWVWMIGQLPTLLSATVIHIHDVFLWFWPVWPVVKLWSWCLFQPIRIITTFHGWEGTYPPTRWQRFNKWVAQRGSTATVAVGDYLSQFYPIQPSAVVYGGVGPIPQASGVTQAGSSSPTPDFIYVGRLAPDTGLPWLLAALKTLQSQPRTELTGEFWGDGPLKAACAEVGEVKGWVPDPLAALSQQPTAWLIASGYLTVLEALATSHRVLVIADNPLKQAYYSQAAFADYLTIVTSPDEVVDALHRRILTATERGQLKTRARFVQTKFTWSALAAKYLHLYATPS
jgi:glycosyltransferase involved in cell wall biosynthesis